MSVELFQKGKAGKQLVEKSFHAENAATRLFELGRVDNDGRERFLRQNAFEIFRQLGSDESPIRDDAVRNKLHGLAVADFVNTAKAFANGWERRRRERAGVNQNSVLIQGTKTGVEVIEVRIGQLQRRHGKAEFVHLQSEPIDRTAS